MTRENPELRCARLGAGAYAALCVAALLTIVIPARVAAETALVEAFAPLRTGLENPNSILAVNLFGDEVPEIVATDVRGQLMIFDARRGQMVIGVRHPDGVGFSAPNVGGFAGDGTLDIVVGAEDGSIQIYDGGSLNRMAMGRLSSNPFYLAPTVVELPDPEGRRETIPVVLTADHGGTVFAVYLNSEGNIVPYWPPVVSGATVPHPITMGNVRSEEVPDVVVPMSDGRVLLINAHTGEDVRFTVKERQRVSTSVLLVDTNGNGRDEMIMAMPNGEIQIRSFDTDTRRLTELRALSTQTEPVSDPTLAKPLDVSDRNGLVFLAGRERIVSLNLSNETVTRTEDRAFSSINTPLTVVPSQTGYPAVAYGFSNLVRYMPTDRWFRDSHEVDYPSISIGEPVAGAMVVVGVPEEGQETLHRYTLIGITTSGRLFGVRTPMTYRRTTTATVSEYAPWLSPWMTRGGKPSRSGRIETAFFERETDRLEQLNREISERTAIWEAAMEAGDWETALEAALWRRNYDPFHEQFAREYRQTWIRKNLLWLIVGGIALLLALALASYLIGRLAYIKTLERRARAAISQGKLPEAEALYEKLLQLRRNNPKAVATLAMVYMSGRNYDEKTIAIYSKARETDPQNPKLLQCHAQALLKAGQFDAEARAVYQAALKDSPEPPQLEYAIGMCWKSEGDLEEAAKSLRAALRAGLTSNAVYSALCDVYLAADIRTAKALPIYKNQYRLRQDDPKFLEAYLEACIDAKESDSSVESLCHMVLQENPANVPAYLHLASTHLQRKELGPAAEEAKRALKVAPDHPRATLMLAQIYLVGNRDDGEARDAYLQALLHDPGNADLLRSLAAILLRENRFDADAVKIYRASLEANPKDTETLRALAKVAHLTSDHSLAVRCIETLGEMGYGDPELTAQLADAYVALEVTDGKAERVLRDALRRRPGDPKLVEGLSRVLVLQENESEEAIPIYETRMRLEPSDRPAGTMLVRSFIRANRYEEALRLAQDLLKQHPEDAELQRLVALSSLYDNKLDEAVAEYESILERNPDDREALFHLAMAYSHKGRTDERSARLYQQAIDYRAESPELHIAMARVHQARGDSVKAVECYQRLSRECPGSGEVLVRHLNQVLAEQPEATRLRRFLCETLVNNNNLREALDQLNIIFDKNPNHGRNVLTALDTILSMDTQNVPGLMTRARVLKAVGELDDACETLEKAYKLQPSSPEIIRALSDAYEKRLARNDDIETRFRLGRLYYMCQEYDKAIGNFQKTAQDYRWEAESIKMLGKCFTNKGMLDLALQEFKKLVVDDETKELLYDLAQRYESKKDLVGAKTVYRQLFAADIDYKDVRTRFEMLSGSTSDPMAFEKTSIVQEMSEEAKRRYELLDELGRGAMGIVYRAKDKELDEVVALKILPDAMSNNPEAVRRFKIEARNARKLSHPNIVRIHDIGEEMGRKYISMEYVDGSDLKKKVREDGKLSEKDFFHYAIQTADALAYAHRLGIVHRDIKPANIMLNSADEVKVTDFGIAKMLDSNVAAEGTMVGAVIGTPLYMSPEQVKGLPVDNRADLYSFGIMLFELLNGKPPFTQGDLSYHHLHTPVERPENVPDPIWDIVEKCLAKEKEDRWASAEEIVEALKDARKQEGG